MVMSQKFEQLPPIGGDLDQWYSDVTHDIKAPIMKGVYFYHGEEEIISPGQTPFYKEGWDPQGTLTFEGRHFSNLNITYHIANDLLLIWNWDMDVDGTPSLLVEQSKIDSFQIHHEVFVHNRYAKIDMKGSSGFYRKVMYANQVSCYAKESKSGHLDGTIYKFDEKRQYFVRYDNVTYPYKRKSTLYKIFPDYKKEIKAFVRENYSSSRSSDWLLINVLHYLDPML